MQSVEYVSRCARLGKNYQKFQNRYEDSKVRLLTETETLPYLADATGFTVVMAVFGQL